MPMAYEGPLPYVFVSYSHRDKEFVHAVIQHLQSAGCRVWFDGGIEAGSEWPEYIAAHLQNCHCVLSFISGSFVVSDNCKRELNFAQDLKKPMLNVFIEAVDLTPGMRMQLGLNQALYRSNAQNDRIFMDALARARILEGCRETPAAAPVGPHNTIEPTEKETPAAVRTQPAAPETKSASAEASSTAQKNAEPPMPFGAKLLRMLMILFELSYCAVFPLLLCIPMVRQMGAFSLIALMVVPHVAIAVLNTLLYRKLADMTTRPQRGSFSIYVLIMSVVSSVAAAIIGRSFLPYAIGGFLRFLISVGLNILPTAITLIIYFMMIGADAPSGK